MLLSRLAYPLIIPVLILLSAFWLRTNISLLSASYIGLLNYLPYTLLTVSCFLSLQFNQLRSLLIVIVLSVSYLIIQLYLQHSLTERPALNIYILLSTLIPFLVILISWIPERGIATSFALKSILVISLPIIAAMYLTFNPELLLVVQDSLPIRQWRYSILSPLVIVIYLLALVHQLCRLWYYQQPFDAAVSIVLIAILINFVQFDLDFISLVVFSAIQFILIWAVLKQSHNMAYLDELTSLPGRRALNEVLKSPGRKYVLAMLDIDFFKKFNDKYGHDVGDDVLKIVASKMAQVTGGGKAYRYGGEEFTILFKAKNLESCIVHLEAVREDIAHYSLVLREKSSRPKSLKAGRQKRGTGRNPRNIKVTISIGVAQKTAKLSTATEVLKAADKALYKAKKAGRNCLVSNK